jgi:uncharacterized membrane protein
MLPQYIVSALIYTVVVVVLVLINLPRTKEENQMTKGRVLKIIIMSFIVCALISYLFQDNDNDNMMSNILKSEPDF